MRAYLAILWDEQQPAKAAAQHLNARIRKAVGTSSANLITPGFSLYELSALRSGPSIIRLQTPEPGSGAIFGQIFRNGPSSSALSPGPLGAEESQRISRSGGLRLMTDYWGSYVAFLRTASEAHILADPTSALPCYYMQQSGLLLVFSHLEKCPFLDRSALSINYDFLSQLLLYDKIQTGNTGLNEVSELAGGTRLTYRSGKVTLQTLWDPRDFAADVYEPTIEQAAEELRGVTLDVVGKRAKASQSVSLRLSGGLDSSIVLACARESLPRSGLNALHYVLQSGDMPELRYAELAARQASCRLIRVETPVVAHLPVAGTQPLTARPHRSAVAHNLFSLSPITVDVGNAVFTGQGGDHLFLDSRNGLGFADHLRRHGLCRDSLRVLLESARLAETTIWNTLRQGLPYAMGRLPESSIRTTLQNRQTSALGAEATYSQMMASLPGWVTSPRKLPPGKFQQVNHLFHMMHAREVTDLSGDRELVHPLMSQPLIELCLRLPVYYLCTDGRSRGLARQAFRGMIPDEIRRRTTKGSASRYFADTADRHRQTISETLLEGELVKEGLLDRRLLAEFLRPDLAGLRPLERLSLVYYAVEIWLARWKAFLNHQPREDWN